MSPRTAGGVFSVLAIVVAAGTPLVAQQRIPGWNRVAGPGEHAYNVQLLRPTGGPVVPILNGWYVNPDGTRELRFGYFNVNTESNPLSVDPDQWVTWGQRSVDAMAHMFVYANYLTEEEYEALKAERAQRLVSEEEDGGG